MGSRRRAREMALQVLYQIDITKSDPEGALELFLKNFETAEKERNFWIKLVRGVSHLREEIDFLIENSSEHWKLSRMATVDRNILRMAVYEVLYCSDIPVKVTLNEAIDLGKKYGTEDSGSFINGVLDNIISTWKRNRSSQG